MPQGYAGDGERQVTQKEQQSRGPRSGSLFLLLAATAFLLLLAAAFLPSEIQFSAATYLPLHTAMEVFSIVVAWLVFAVGWNTHDEERAGTTSWLACGFLAVALLDFGHTLSYSGMPNFVTPASAEKAIHFSFAARAVAAFALLGLALLPWRRLRRRALRYVYLGATLLGVWLLHWVFLFRPDWVPRTFVPGTGLTPFKIAIEYVLFAAHLLAAWGFFYRLRKEASPRWGYMFAASCLMAASQLFTTFYAHPYDIHNFLAHAYRLVGYVLLYRGLFISGIREPFATARKLRDELDLSAQRLRALGARVRGDIEAERKRLARSLHDELGQDLTALRMDLGWMQRHYGDHTELVTAVERMRQTVDGTAMAMRRIISDLRPPMLDDLGIVAAATTLTKDLAARTGLRVELDTDGEFEALPEAHQTAIYRMLQEGLTNVVRHAAATQVEVSLRAGERRVELRIRDNGRGFTEEARRKEASFGLFGLGEWAGQLGGRVEIDSRPGAGTTVSVSVPWTQPLPSLVA
jgi:signal transduction histidine kinase